MHSTSFTYSRGTSKLDNRPLQKNTKNFEEFAETILADLSTEKGKTYICAPMKKGFHSDQSKYAHEDTYRLKALAEERHFLPFDIDGFKKKETFEELIDWLVGRYRFFAYTTASSTPDAPRCRLILMQSRGTNVGECIRLGKIVQTEIERVFGFEEIHFDSSVYRPEQPLFTPVKAGNWEHYKHFKSFVGDVIDVDRFLTSITHLSASPRNTISDPVLIELNKQGKTKEIGPGKYSVICPFEDEHSTRRKDESDTSTVYFLPNYGGHPKGNFHCLHTHCEGRPQNDYWERLGITTLDEFDIAVDRLSKLREHEYDQLRKSEAKKLGTQLVTLDLAVKKAKSNQTTTSDEMFDDVIPWDLPVDPADLLSEIESTIRRFIVCDADTITAATLWIVMTWFIDEIAVAPLAVITAPTKGCGKTQLLTVIGKLSCKPLQTSNITSAALFRSIEKWSPTLLIDEVDSFLRNNEDMRGVLNAGHTRDSAYVIRSVGDEHEPTKFKVWGAKALCGIGCLQPTLMDRALVLELRKKLPTETSERIRHTPNDLFEKLKRKIARFAQDYADDVCNAKPDLPDELDDRAQDNWEPLLAIANCAGSEWVTKAESAALLISAKRKEELNYGSDLLADIQEIFLTRRISKIFKDDLYSYLTQDDEKSWSTYNLGKPISWSQVAKKLKAYSIESKQIRIGDQNRKGFALEDFTDVFSRYLNIDFSQSVLSSEVKSNPEKNSKANCGYEEINILDVPKDILDLL